jgi:hypothetical protein
MLYDVTVAWGDESVVVTVQADGPDDAFSADVGSELPDHWPDEGWEITDAQFHSSE